MVSTVKEKHIANLQAARYLAADIEHRLPDHGQVVPTLLPQERVMFVSHFVHGLGFPLHPFVRGLMFYYELDFHDLAPNFFLNISAFIVVCEAFLRICPISAYGLRLSTSSQRWCAAARRSGAVPWLARWPTSCGSRAPLWRP